MKKPGLKIYLPVLLSFVLLIGIFLGNHMTITPGSGWSMFKTEDRAYGHLIDVINLIQQDYVDELSAEEIGVAAVKSLLETLDPHSDYIPPGRFDELNDPLEGNFDGIGVQFRMVKDTIIVIQAIPQGPSEKVGIMAGDRIVKVNGKSVAGENIPTDSIVRMLKGPKGTKVEVDIFRSGSKEIMNFDIKRGKIPTYSLDIAYMVNQTTAYVKLNKFSATTDEELHEALKELKAEGMQELILDLRGNGGGYLSAAIRVADEFLKKGELIVYTEGKSRPRREEEGTNYGVFEQGALVVLIDELSASASEIVAGAVQDNGRGTIIGRRSFGKGLVQEQMQLENGGAIRLTVARYHTPSGRSIQKSYKNGNPEDYYLELLNRYQAGEMNSEDSVPRDSAEFYLTQDGDTVYGGGGIYPDIFIPLQSEWPNDLAQELVQRGLIFRFAFQYTDKNRAAFQQYPLAEDFNREFQVSSTLMNNFKTYISNSGMTVKQNEFNKAQEFIRYRMKAFIGRNLFDNEGFYPTLNQIDSGFKEAVNYLEQQKKGSTSQ